MKRRNFIKSSLVTGAAPVLASSGRLYGEPASLRPREVSESGKYLLPLSRSGIPAEAWDHYSKLSLAVENLLSSKSEAAKFSANPAKYLASLGMDSSEETLQLESVRLLVAITHPAVVEALSSRDYELAVNILTSEGVIECRQKSDLTVRTEKILLDNMATVRASLKASPRSELTEAQQQSLVASLVEKGVSADEGDLAALAVVLKSGGVTAASCTVFAVCAAVIALSVIAAAALSVYNLALVATHVQVVTTAAPQRASKELPLTGAVSKLDPTLLRNTNRMIRLARMTGDPGLEIYAMRSLVREECEALIRALRATSLLKLTKKREPFVIEALTQYAYKTAGI